MFLMILLILLAIIIVVLEGLKFWTYTLQSPLCHSRATQETFHHIVDKVQEWLTRWKSKHLTLSVRIRLCMYVISALLIFTV